MMLARFANGADAMQCIAQIITVYHHALVLIACGQNMFCNEQASRQQPSQEQFFAFVLSNFAA